MESNSTARQITAKFSSFCPDCRQPITAGSQVMWAPGTKAVHVICPVSVKEWNAEAEQALSEGYVKCTLESSDKDDRSYEAWVAFMASQTKAVAPVAQITVEDAGVYVMPDGTIVKVQANADKTRTYAKRFVDTSSDRLNGEDEHVRGEFRYEAGLVAQVAQNGRKMTLEEAKAFIRRYGFCVRCSRHLKVAKSIEQGMGDKCFSYFSGVSGASVLLAA